MYDTENISLDPETHSLPVLADVPEGLFCAGQCSDLMEVVLVDIDSGTGGPRVHKPSEGGETRKATACPVPLMSLTTLEGRQNRGVREQTASPGTGRGVGTGPTGGWGGSGE